MSSTPAPSSITTNLNSMTASSLVTLPSLSSPASNPIINHTNPTPYNEQFNISNYIKSNNDTAIVNMKCMMIGYNNSYISGDIDGKISTLENAKILKKKDLQTKKEELHLEIHRSMNYFKMNTIRYCNWNLTACTDWLKQNVLPMNECNFLISELNKILDAKIDLLKKETEKKENEKSISNHDLFKMR